MTTTSAAAPPARRPGGQALPQTPRAVSRRRTVLIFLGLAAAVAGLQLQNAEPQSPGGALLSPREHPAASMVAEPPIPAWASRPAVETREQPDRRAQGSGSLAVAPGSSRPVGQDKPERFIVEVERGLGVAPGVFAAAVEQALFSQKGWARHGFPLQRVGAGPASFRVTLASAETTDELCWGMQTKGRYSCWNESRAVINFTRWVKATPDYAGAVAAYRRYAINHEVGHALGHGHQACPSAGALAPVMMQQTKGLRDCRPNPWPFP